MKYEIIVYKLDHVVVQNIETKKILQISFEMLDECRKQNLLGE